MDSGFEPGTLRFLGGSDEPAGCFPKCIALLFVFIETLCCRPATGPFGY